MGSNLFYFEAEESYGYHQAEESHFLDTCCRCRRPLAADRDIFVYKEINAFCSDECRQSQIEIDSRPPWQPKKTCWDLSASFRALDRLISSPEIELGFRLLPVSNFFI